MDIKHNFVSFSPDEQQMLGQPNQAVHIDDLNLEDALESFMDMTADLREIVSERYDPANLDVKSEEFRLQRIEYNSLNLAFMSMYGTLHDIKMKRGLTLIQANK